MRRRAKWSARRFARHPNFSRARSKPRNLGSGNYADLCFCRCTYADLWFVDGIMVFGDYFKKYARYEDQPKSENREN